VTPGESAASSNFSAPSISKRDREREMPGDGYAERTLYLVACVKLANDRFRAVGSGEAKVRRGQ
jgi:hypothetical protein